MLIMEGCDSGTAVYRGVPLKKVLKKACGGVLPECQHLEFIGADTYFKSASRRGVLFAKRTF